jgi:hypothetical protein
MSLKRSSRIRRGACKVGRRRGGDTCHFWLQQNEAAAMFTENGGRYFELVVGVDVAFDM